MKNKREDITQTMNTLPGGGAFLGMPGPVWSMAALMLLGGALLGLSFLFPLSDRPGGPYAFVGIVLVIQAMTAFLVPHTGHTKWWVYMSVTIWITAMAFLIYPSTELEIATLLLGFPIVFIYIGYWLPRRHGIIFGVYASLSTLAVIHILGLLDTLTLVWVAFMVFSWMLWLFVYMLNSRLRELSTHDPLTGLLNRTGLEIALTPVNSRNTRELPTTIAVIDLDGFKQVNDARGHHEGDRILRAVAYELQSNLRPHDIVARTGGDEFVVVFPGTSPDNAWLAFNRAVAKFPIGFSVGLHLWDPEESYDAAVAAADEMMYENKARNTGPTE